ncbi:MAG: NAD(P)H-dependent oxidoreductase [Bryobacteraceae bacterium]
MARRITIIEGHPDADASRFGRALADAYARGAEAGGHEVRQIRVAELEFPVLRSRREWVECPPAPAIRQSQEAIAWSDHVVILYPLWLGTVPALLKAFFEQVMRPGFAVGKLIEGKPGPKLLAGRSARVVVSMCMPALVFRCFFSHGLRVVKQSILGFCGINPVSATLIGMVGEKDAKLDKWIDRMEALGRVGR